MSLAASSTSSSADRNAPGRHTKTAGEAFRPPWKCQRHVFESDMRCPYRVPGGLKASPTGIYRRRVGHAFLPGLFGERYDGEGSSTPRPFFALVVLAALFAGLTLACGGSDKSDVTVATTTPASGARATSTSDKPSSGAPTSVSGNTQASNESVSFSSSDGTTIKGHFYSAPGPKRRALIIASVVEQKTWGAYASQLANQGIALLTFDIRGIGETGRARNDALLDKDIEVAVNLVKSRDYPLVYVFGVGADSALAAIKVAARNELAGIATYSASAAARSDIANVKEPKLLLANENNSDASAALSTLANAAPDPVRRVALASNPPAADPLSAADARLALIDFVLGK